ncbi:MAG: sigma 54-interacting transcriptional regulator [Deltaproteobacteria bacterium]|nr:sigma 54-interacting transcriptional regulator [Deltaproteobacteria bacterium]
MPDPPPAPADSARFRLLYDLGRAFAERVELDELMPLVLERCRTALAAEGATIFLADPGARELEVTYNAADAADVTAKLRSIRVAADRSIAGAVLRSGRAERIDDPSADPRFTGDVDRITGTVTRGILCAPLVTGRGAIGVLQVVNRVGGSFDDADLGFLAALAGSVAIAIENARMYARIRADEERLRTQVGALRRDLATRDAEREIVGTSPAMANVRRLMERAATSPIAVLVEGETGTGKELAARAIHRASARADGPFIAVNCAALSESLLESELFGHRRGAFTGALQDRRGLFEAASGGTVFLDEVGEMPPGMQAKLLRVLQEGEVVPVGDTRPRAVDVRVISATNRNLREEVARKGFREDLFYRLAAFPIRLPPLRERRDDVPLLVDRFLREACRQLGREVPRIELESTRRLAEYAWPGNIRELANEIQRAVALAQPGEAIGVDHLSPHVVAATGVGAGPNASAADPQACGLATAGAAPASTAASLRDARTAFERDFIAGALRQNGGNVTRTAQAIGLSRVMLQKKMKELDLRSS